MKTVHLKNPEQAQQVFVTNGWTDQASYFIKCVGTDGVNTLLDVNGFKSYLVAVDLKVNLGCEYSIPLTDYDNDITIELKDINDLGALLIINNEPFLLRSYDTANDLIIDKIGSSFPGLRKLDLSWSKNITDLNPLCNLHQLSSLILSGLINLTDLSPLIGLSGLRYLNLSSCKIIDLSPLKGLKDLTNLNLSENFLLEDLSPLIGLSGLSYLNLSQCGIKDLSPLIGLSGLRYLDLSHNFILKDLSPLKGLNGLTNLNLRGNMSKDFSPLVGLHGLTNLNLSHCRNLTDLSSLMGLNELKKLNLIRCRNLADFRSLTSLHGLTNLNLSDCINLTDLTPLMGLHCLTYLNLNGCNNLTDFTPLKGLHWLTNLALSHCKNLTDLSMLSGLHYLNNLNLNWCEMLIKVSPIVHLRHLRKIQIGHCPNIRDIEKLASLPQLKELTWIDPVICSKILMQSAFNRNDADYVLSNITQWISEISLSKDAVSFVSKILNCITLLQQNKKIQILIELSNAMRSRGLQSEDLNDFDVFTWESWCNLVLDIDPNAAMDCFNIAVADLNIQRETEVLLDPVIIAASELIEKHPDIKEQIVMFVDTQLQQLTGHDAEERQIAPSAAVFFASLNMKDEVLFWLKKATDEKAPLWRDKVLLALISYYAAKEEFVECRRLLDQMQIQDEKDQAIASLSQAMANSYPIEAVFMLDDIHDFKISTEAARKLLEDPSVLEQPQGVYQLFLHLQSNPDELAKTLATLVEKYQEGKVAEAVTRLFLQKQSAGPSAAVMLELCKHPVVGQFVKAWKLEELIKQLNEESAKEQKEYATEFIDMLERKSLIDSQENEIMKAKMLN